MMSSLFIQCVDQPSLLNIGQYRIRERGKMKCPSLCFIEYFSFYDINVYNVSFVAFIYRFV